MLVEVLECVVDELFPIIRDEDFGDSEAANDAFQDEVSDIILSDSGQRFHLNPFNEIVDPYDEEFELLYCHGEGSHYVGPSLSEWLGSIHWGKLF